MAEADPKDGQLPVGESPDCIDRVTDGRWVPGTVGEEDAIGFHRADLSRSRCGRHDRHAAALLHEQAENVAFHAEVERHDVMGGVARSFCIRVGNRRDARQVESVHRR